MFSKRFVAASAVALISLASFAGEPPASLKVADPASQVASTTYTSVLSTYKPAADPDVAPDKAWREANATVAGESMQGGAHAGHAPAVQDAGAHAGHTMPTPGANPDAHGNHGAPAKQTGQVPHEGHQMPAKAAAKSDPHAGHQMPQKPPATKVARPVPASGAKNESQHGQQHQEKEAKK